MGQATTRREIALQNRARCWKAESPPCGSQLDSCENILALSPNQSAITPPPEFLACVRRAFEWFFHVYLPSLDPESQSAANLVRQHLELLGLPESLEEEPESDSPENQDPDLADMLEFLDSRLHGDRVTFDRGNRMYHAMTTVKKDIRRRCTLAGERIVEVDMHASFVAAITYLYARGEERERLIEMLQTGKFYAEFAELAEITVENAKEQFQRDVVFSFRRGGNPLWQVFREHFPDTAFRLSQDRDWGDVVKVKRKKNKNEEWFTCKTREGQRFLSRRLSMVESQIFWRRALMRLWNEQGIPALPVHDCLLVRGSDAEATRKMILECAEEVLGFRPAVKVNGG